MNILHFGKFYHSVAGGVETYVDTLLQCMGKKHGVVNLVASVGWQFSEIDTPYSHVVQVPSLGQFMSTSLCLTMPYQAWKLNHIRSFDIAHLHFPDPMSHFSSFFLPKQVKRVVTWHSDIVRQKELFKLYRPFLKSFLNGVDAIITTNPVDHAFPQLYDMVQDTSKIHAIPIGIDAQKFATPNLKAVQQLQAQYGHRPIIFALGRHVAYKGFDYLIRAMANVQDAVLVLGGNGPLTSELKALVQTLSLQDKVFFVGRIEDKDLPTYYHAAEIFCMPSVERNEAYGIVQLEAMACGKPVVCCELNNGVTFVNQHQKTGLVVPPKDVAALADALNALLQDATLRRALGEYAANRVKTELTDQVMTDRVLAIYQGLF